MSILDLIQDNMISCYKFIPVSGTLSAGMSAFSLCQGGTLSSGIPGTVCSGKAGTLYSGITGTLWAGLYIIIAQSIISK